LQISASASRQQLQPLTSLRFFAAIYVVIYHYWTSYHLGDVRPLVVELGQTGVTFFFLLSGFILSYSYDDGGSFPKDRRGRFYLARFARIYPVYIATILVMFPALVVLKNTGVADQHYRELWAITSPLALHAWIPGAACSLNCPNWSISTEVFFYLLFPVVFAPIYRRPVLAISLACAAMALIWLVQIQMWTGSGRTLAGMKTAMFESDPDGHLLMQLFTYLPLTRLPEFLAGIGLYGVWRRGADRIPSSRLYVTAGLGAAIVVAAASWLPENILRTGFTTICYAPLILAAANSCSGPLFRPDFVWLGQISFALYLVHSPVDSYLRTIDRVALGSQLAGMPLLFFGIATVAALISAALLFHFLEEPARKAIVRVFDSSATERRSLAGRT
jgi:peptidoglycan/LPS O-acetylase OafA/YrhL